MFGFLSSIRVSQGIGWEGRLDNFQISEEAMRTKPGTPVQNGFTLIEVLIALAVGGLLMTAVLAIFIMQNNSYTRQEQMTQMVQTARAAMDMLGREIRMAGYDPTGAGFDGIAYSAGKLRLQADLRGDQPGDPPDGDTADPNEEITYRFDSVHLQIDRNTGGGNQPFAENIEEFTFDYFDREGRPTTVNSEIRQIRVRITARADRSDPRYGTNDGYRTYTLRSTITPPNLACW